MASQLVNLISVFFLHPEHCVQFTFLIYDSPIFNTKKSNQISHSGFLVCEKVVSFTSPNFYYFET